MIPGAFDYLAPKSVEETVALLAQHGDDAKVLAGGQSLIPAMRFRLASPALLIDINNLTELEYVREENGHLAIGALAREVMLEESAAIARTFPLLSDAARVIADPLVRNRATVGGNIAHADPANDHPAVMLAYGAQVRGARPQRHARHPDRRFLRRPVRDLAAAGRAADRDPHSPAGARIPAART